MHGLFRSNGEPVAPAVADTWGKVPRRNDAEQAQRVAFFPSGSLGSIAAVNAAPSATPEVRRSVDIPLPQARPAGLAAPADAVVPASGARRARTEPGGRPLDLLRHIKADART